MNNQTVNHADALRIARPELLVTRNHISGEWCDAGGGARFEVSDPAIDEPFIEVANSGPDDALAAVDAAERAFPAWRNRHAQDRARLLKRWHDLIVENTEDLARLMAREQGKPMAEARGEVAYSAAYVEWFSEEAVRTYGHVIPSAIPGNQQSAVKEPVGIVAAITPWNYPMAMIARKIAPALAVGCTVVAKPAEDTPLSALALVKLAQDAGIPPGVVNIVTASRAQTPSVVDVWLKDFRVRKITFTGSTPVGKHLAQASSGNLKRLSLELGGNAPFIVFDDADIESAVAGLMSGKFRNSGQTCVCPNRIYVHDRVYDEFSAKLTARTKALAVGPASVPDSEIGPLINERAVEKVERHVQDALAAGATLLTGGHRLRNEIANGPFYFEPTVLGNVAGNTLVCNEETFGPVAPLFRFEDEDDVVQRANDTPFGLASYFYSTDIRRIHRLSRQLQSGVVGINQGATASPVAPFGGVKESGYGREGSRYGLDDYLQIKYLCQGDID